MKYKVIVKQTIVTTAIVTAESDRGAVEKLLSHHQCDMEIASSQTWEEPHVECVVEYEE